MNNTKAQLISIYRQLQKINSELIMIPNTVNVVDSICDATKELDFLIQNTPRPIMECETKECDTCKGCSPEIFYLEGEE